MIYDFSLRSVGLLVGLGLVITHVFAWAMPRSVMPWLRQFPRSRPAGVVLCSLAALWAFGLVATMDLGEFSPSRTLICLVVAVGAVMVPLFAEEFLAVRALGILALLAVEPLLGAAFLRPETSRLFLVLLAYGWAIGGLVLVGAPYVLRDAITWLTANECRYKWAATVGAFYGVVLLAVSLLFFAS